MAKTTGYLNYYGYNPPFFGGHQNVLSRQAGERIIKNDILQLIMTSPGERVMRSQWGTIVNASLFEPITDETINAIRMSITQALATYEPRVQVAVNVSVDADNNTLNIILYGTYTNQPNMTFLQEISRQLPTVGG